MHRSSLLLVLSVGGLAATACNTFRSPLQQRPVVSVSAGDVNLSARWNATLVSPSSLAGAVQMKGTGSMTPGDAAGKTLVSVELSNASPGGVHPWQLRRGQCGMDDGVFGMTDAYKPLTIDDQGRASSTVTVPLAIPTAGNYYIRVGASAANPEMVVACGNLAPPTQ